MTNHLGLVLPVVYYQEHCIWSRQLYPKFNGEHNITNHTLFQTESFCEVFREANISVLFPLCEKMEAFWPLWSNDQSNLYNQSYTYLYKILESALELWLFNLERAFLISK